MVRLKSTVASSYLSPFIFNIELSDEILSEHSLTNKTLYNIFNLQSEILKYLHFGTLQRDKYICKVTDLYLIERSLLQSVVNLSIILFIYFLFHKTGIACYLYSQ